MTSGHGEEESVFELTVVGPLGPVLARALEPCATASRESQTILRASLPGTRDLLDLLRLLEARGLEITNITALWGGHHGEGSHPPSDATGKGREDRPLRG